MSLFKMLITKVCGGLSSSVRSKYRAFPLLLTPISDHYEPKKRSYTSTSATGIAKCSEASADLQVKVTSREMIKPSSPTPHHMKSVLLSIIDQMQPSYHMPLILFYQNNDDHPINHIQRSTGLKKSLSQTLVCFYPLAGRLEGNESINCDDQGVEFCEAYVCNDLTKVIENPNLEELQALLPFKAKPSHKNIVLSIQLNHFSCGGTAISLRISHKIADGASISAFLTAWATISRTQFPGASHGSSSALPWPMFNGASLFPPLKELAEIHPGDDREIYTEKITSKRVLFDKKIINELKTQAGSTHNPTRVEVVTAFIWKRLLMADPTSKIGSVMHAVNCRTRMVPPISQELFGNCCSPTKTSPLINGQETEFPELVYSIRKAINKIDDDYLTPLLKGNQRWFEISKEMNNFTHGEDTCFFTSLCKFPLYQVNFGMGQPIWACITTYPVTNMVVLSNTICGNGVKAWIHMRQHDIDALHHRHLHLDLMVNN